MSDNAIEDAEERLRQAMLGSDVEALDALIADGLVFVSPSGAVIDKESDLLSHRTGVTRISGLEPSDRRIERYGAAAVVSVLMKVTGEFAGQPMSGDFRYTRFWVEQPAGWQVVGGSICPAP